MVKSQSPGPPFILHYAIIQGERGIFLTFSVFELQRGYLYQNGVEFRQKVIGAGLNLVIFTTSQGYMDLSPAVGHVRECPHSGTRYHVFICYYKLNFAWSCGNKIVSMECFEYSAKTP